MKASGLDLAFFLIDVQIMVDQLVPSQNGNVFLCGPATGLPKRSTADWADRVGWIWVQVVGTDIWFQPHCFAFITYNQPMRAGLFGFSIRRYIGLVLHATDPDSAQATAADRAKIN